MWVRVGCWKRRSSEVRVGVGGVKWAQRWRVERGGEGGSGRSGRVRGGGVGGGD